MNTQLKSIASMSLWFSIGLIAAILLYKPKLIGIDLNDSGAKNINKVDTFPAQADSRFLYNSKYKPQKI